jgi:predicted Zn-dependent protease
LPAGLRAEGPCAGAEPFLVAATRALEDGQWDEAEGKLRPLASSHPECARLVAGQARLRAGRGDAAEADRLFARAAALGPEDATVQALAAGYWLARGQRARADYLASLAQALAPDDPDALVVHGRILAEKGRALEARQAFERAVLRDPAHVEARYQLGVSLYRHQIYPDAAAHLEKVVAARPHDARAHDYLAQSLEGLGEADRADRAYRAAQEVNDGPLPDPFFDYYYGRFLLKQDRLEESRTHLDRALARHPRERAVHYERAKLGLAAGRYPAARDDAERALQLPDPAGLVLDLQLHYLLATAYARLGDPERARTHADLARAAPIPDKRDDR